MVGQWVDPGLEQLHGETLKVLCSRGVGGPTHPGAAGGEQLSGGVEEGQFFEGRAAEAEAGVVGALRTESGTSGGADGAEVQHAVALLAQGGHLPGLGKHSSGELAGGGGSWVAAAAFDRSLERVILTGAVLLVPLLQLGVVHHVLKSGNVGGHARVKEGTVREEEDRLFV